MFLPFYVGQYSVTPALLEHFIPAFSNRSEVSTDGGIFLQLNSTFQKADNLVLHYFVQPGGSWQNLCLVPLLIALNLTFAFVMQCIARHTRIADAIRQAKRSEDKYSAFTALLRDLSGVQSVYFISRGWLASPSYKWISRSLCILTIVHWFAREWLYANFLSSLAANLANAVVALPTSKVSWISFVNFTWNRPREVQVVHSCAKASPKSQQTQHRCKDFRFFVADINDT